MGNSSAKSESNPSLMAAADTKINEGSGKKDKKPCPACSACQETRKIRDACVFEKGEENCGDLIEAHKQCLRDHGMKI